MSSKETCAAEKTFSYESRGPWKLQRRIPMNGWMNIGRLVVTLPIGLGTSRLGGGCALPSRTTPSPKWEQNTQAEWRNPFRNLHLGAGLLWLSSESFPEETLEGLIVLNRYAEYRDWLKGCALCHSAAPPLSR